MARARSAQKVSKKAFPRRTKKVVSTKGIDTSPQSRSVGAGKSARRPSGASQAEAERLLGEERLAILQEAAGIGLWEWDVVSRVIDCSPECGRLHGIPIDESVPLTSEEWLERFYPADRQRANQEAIAALEGRREYCLQYRVVWPDGSLHWLFGKAKVFRDSRGQPIRMLGITMDITERITAEEAHRTTAQRFELFMKHLPAAATIKDLSGRFVYANPKVERLAARPREQWVGRTADEIWPDVLAAQVKEHDRQVIRTGRASTQEYAWQTPGGFRYYQSVHFPIPGADGATALVGGVALDITARKRAEQERRILLAKLASAQEDERRRISRELHDDLTQRLAALGMEMGGLLANRQRLSPAIRRQLRLVQRAVIQAAEISRDVAHELHPSELDELGLVATLRSHCRDFARRAGVAVQFVSRTEPSALHRAAASCLYKVAQESLHNVAKHARATRVRVSLEENEDSIRLRVEDNGAGFAPSGPRARAGLGLGNMRDRMELVEGQITVQSRPGHGTRIMAEISSRLARLDSGEHGTQGRK